MNLAYNNPIMFWNTACLISDAGGMDNSDEEDIDEEALEENKTEEKYIEEMDWFNEESDKEVSSYDEDDGENGWPATIVVTESGKKKKKIKATNYGKIAAAIGRIKSTGVTVGAPDINKSSFTFSPDIEHNQIRYGISGITRIGGDLVKTIIANRPYTSIEDFLSKVKVNKTQMVNLIKSGAFDAFGDRVELMKEYIGSICGAKKRLTLQNMKMLIDYQMLPDELSFECKVFNYNKYLKKMKDKDLYLMDNIAFAFYEKNFDMDLLIPAPTESGFAIKQVKWDKIYQKYMDNVRPYIKKYHDEMLDKLNSTLMSEVWDKYCAGSISKWEMDSISCYIKEHELESIDYDAYGWDRFEDLNEKPIVDRVIPIKGKMIPIFKLNRIVGTVLDRDKAKKTITLLTTGGVVLVKAYGIFPAYDKQISEKDENGHKHVIEKSAFSRGNKIVVTGIRDGENEFRCKTYKNTPFHHIEIIEINGDEISTRQRGEIDQ